MNKGEQPAADAQWGLGLSEERGAVRRDAGEKTYGKMSWGIWSSKGAMRNTGVEEGTIGMEILFWKMLCFKRKGQIFPKHPTNTKEQVASDKGWALMPKLTTWRQHHHNKGILF